MDGACWPDSSDGRSVDQDADAVPAAVGPHPLDTLEEEVASAITIQIPDMACGPAQPIAVLRGQKSHPRYSTADPLGTDLAEKPSTTVD